jgi:hypothetical protein
VLIDKKKNVRVFFRDCLSYKKEGRTSLPESNRNQPINVLIPNFNLILICKVRMNELSDLATAHSQVAPQVHRKNRFSIYYYCNISTAICV